MTAKVVAQKVRFFAVGIMLTNETLIARQACARDDRETSGDLYYIYL